MGWYADLSNITPYGIKMDAEGAIWVQKGLF
jgi:hypothetical protein